MLPDPPLAGSGEFVSVADGRPVGARTLSMMQHAPGRPPGTPVDLKVQRAAAAEVQRLRNEISAESAKLAEAVYAQEGEVAALKQRATRAEADAGAARNALQELRLQLLRRSAEAPETLAAIMADYGPPGAPGGRQRCAPAACPRAAACAACPPACAHC